MAVCTQALLQKNLILHSLLQPLSRNNVHVHRGSKPFKRLVNIRFKCQHYQQKLWWPRMVNKAVYAHVCVTWERSRYGNGMKTIHWVWPRAPVGCIYHDNMHHTALLECASLFIRLGIPKVRSDVVFSATSSASSCLVHTAEACTCAGMWPNAHTCLLSSSLPSADTINRRSCWDNGRNDSSSSWQSAKWRQMNHKSRFITMWVRAKHGAIQEWCNETLFHHDHQRGRCSRRHPSPSQLAALDLQYTILRSPLVDLANSLLREATQPEPHDVHASVFNLCQRDWNVQTYYCSEVIQWGAHHLDACSLILEANCNCSAHFDAVLKVCWHPLPVWVNSPESC